MLLAEDLLILLVKRATSNLPRREGTQAALATALLLELAAAGRLGVDRDGAGRLHIFVDNHNPTGDPLLDNALTGITTVDGQTALDVVNAIVPGLYVRLLHRLTDRGALIYRLGGWWTADRTRRDHLIFCLADVLSGRTSVDRRSGALIALLDMMSATSVVATTKAARVQATAIANGNWPADDTTRAIAEACADIVWHWGS